MSAIDPSISSKIDNQLKVSKGKLNMGFEKDEGDASPPNVESSFNQEQTAVDTTLALKTIFGTVNMLFTLVFARIEPIDYIGCNDAEITRLAQAGTTVPELQDLAENSVNSKLMFYATLAVIVGSKFKLSDSYKARKEQEKKEKESTLTKDDLDFLETLQPKKQELINEIIGKPKEPKQEITNMVESVYKREPVYDSPPKDTSKPIEVINQYEETLSPAELKTRELLMDNSEMTRPEIEQRKNENKLRMMNIRKNEIIAEQKGEKSGVKYA